MYKVGNWDGTAAVEHSGLIDDGGTASKMFRYELHITERLRKG